MCGRLDYFLDAFANLRLINTGENGDVNSNNRTRQTSLLLLAVIDEIESGTIVRNFISPSPGLEQLFDDYCTLSLPLDCLASLAIPFCHLAETPFWELKPQPGKFFGRNLETMTMSELRSHYFGAKFSDDLYPLLQMETFRQQLRQVLIDSYFDDAEGQRINDFLGANS